MVLYVDADRTDEPGAAVMGGADVRACAGDFSLFMKTGGRRAMLEHHERLLSYLSHHVGRTWARGVADAVHGQSVGRTAPAG